MTVCRTSSIACNNFCSWTMGQRERAKLEGKEDNLITDSAGGGREGKGSWYGRARYVPLASGPSYCYAGTFRAWRICHHLSCVKGSSIMRAKTLRKCLIFQKNLCWFWYCCLPCKHLHNNSVIQAHVDQRLGNLEKMFVTSVAPLVETMVSFDHLGCCSLASSLVPSCCWTCLAWLASLRTQSLYELGLMLSLLLSQPCPPRVLLLQVLALGIADV